MKKETNALASPESSSKEHHMESPINIEQVKYLKIQMH
jgi:hypothetical protein